MLSRNKRRLGPETDFNRHCRTSISNFSIHFGKQLCQIADLDILKRPHGVLDIPAQLRADMACCELVELGADLLPAEWPRRRASRSLSKPLAKVTKRPARSFFGNGFVPQAGAPPSAFGLIQIWKRRVVCGSRLNSACLMPVPALMT